MFIYNFKTEEIRAEIFFPHKAIPLFFLIFVNSILYTKIFKAYHSQFKKKKQKLNSTQLDSFSTSWFTLLMNLRDKFIVHRN